MPTVLRARRGHEIRERCAGGARAAGQRDLREQRAAHDRDGDRVAAQAHLGLIEIGAASQQLRRQPGLHARHFDVLQRLPLDVETLHVAADEHRERGARGEIALNEALQRVALLLDLDLLLQRVDRTETPASRRACAMRPMTSAFSRFCRAATIRSRISRSWKNVEVAVPSVFIATSAACASRDS